MMKPLFTVVCTLLLSLHAMAQGVINDTNIRSIKLYKAGDQLTLPIIPLGTTEGVELRFDDFGNRVKNYFYTYQLCNADWSPAILRPFEYIKGFQNMRITTYRNSSLATARYIHYTAMLPDRNSYPSRSGNYLLKVFLDNDTSKVVFTRRMVVVDNRAGVSAQVLQPFNGNLFRNYQKLNVVVQTDNRINILSPNDIKVVLLQNNNWLNAVYMDRPTIFRGNYYEYSDEAITSFPATREFRWLDMRSLRLRTDRMDEINNRGDTTRVLMKTEGSREQQQYVFFRDFNGAYFIDADNSVNPFWQGDYAKVHFRYVPPGGRAVEGNEVYIWGELTNFGGDTSGRMIFNPELGIYEKTLYLKQGFYNYMYAYLPQVADASGRRLPQFTGTEGNYFATENNYTVLVYYRPVGGRGDEVIGTAVLNTLFVR